MIKVAIAEDNDFLAYAIRQKLELFNGEIKLKFRGINGADLLRQLENDHNVDIILMDIEMPIMNGVKATEIIKNKYPHIAVIMLTVFDDEEHIFNSILAGANGYLLKDEPADVILGSIKEILNGGAPMSPSIAMKALKLLRNPDAIQIENPKEYNLTKRETEILEHLSKGLSYKLIAENLIISAGTVRKHVENIYKKLRVHNKIEAIQLAKSQGLV